MLLQRAKNRTANHRDARYNRDSVFITVIICIYKDMFGMNKSRTKDQTFFFKSLKKNVFFSLMAGPFTPFPHLNGTAIKKFFFCAASLRSLKTVKYWRIRKNAFSYTNPKELFQRGKQSFLAPGTMYLFSNVRAFCKKNYIIP